MNRQLQRTAVAAAIVAAVAAVGPWLLPHGPDAIDLAARRAAPSLGHWFGTDELGRDLLARVLTGARVSLAIGLLSAAVAGVLGTVIGGTAALARGWVDATLMRLADAMLSIPRLPLLMIAAAILGPSIPVLIAMVGLVGWMETARVVRADVLSLTGRGFVDAARAAGVTPVRVLFRHVVPNVAPTIAVATTLAVARAILLESALSFFGVGVQPPTASWGNMLYQAQTTMTTAPWLALFPGLMIFLTVVAVNRLGERWSQAGGT